MLACVALAVLATPAADADLKAVVSRALKAANADKMKAATKWAFTETVVSGGEFGFTSLRADWVELPDRLRSLNLVARNDGTTTSELFVVNGDKGWAKHDGKVIEMSAEGIALRKRGLPAGGWRIVRALEDPGYEVSLLPARKLGDRQVDAVKAARKGGKGGGATLLFDRESGRLLQRELAVTGRDGKEETQTMTYADVREVGGIPVAHLRTSTMPSAMQVQTNTFTVADKLDPKLFEKPE